METTATPKRRGRPGPMSKPEAAQRAPLQPQKTSLNVVALPIGQIANSPLNPRGNVTSVDVAELKRSIAGEGLLQPITVRPMPEGGYELVLGARRLEACRELWWETIPAIIAEMDDETARRAMIVENLQREGIDPVSEADAVASALLSGMTRLELSARLGKSTRWVASRIAISGMQGEIRDLIRNDALGVAHAEELARVVDPIRRLALAKDAVRARWTVLALRDMVEQDMHEIGSAPWDPRKAFADLQSGHPIPACSGCTQRSDKQADLFDDGHGVPRCLDSSCWERKLASFLAQRRAEVAKCGAVVVDDDDKYRARNGWNGYIKADTPRAEEAKAKGVAPRILIEPDGRSLPVWHQDDLETPEERAVRIAEADAERDARIAKEREERLRTAAMVELAGRHAGKVDADFLMPYIAQALIEADHYSRGPLHELLEKYVTEEQPRRSIIGLTIPTAEIRKAIVMDVAETLMNAENGDEEPLLKLLKVTPKGIQKVADELRQKEQAKADQEADAADEEE